RRVTAVPRRLSTSHPFVSLAPPATAPPTLSLHDALPISAGRHQRAEAAAGDGEREGALHVLAGAHAARADDTLCRVVGEIGVGLDRKSTRLNSSHVKISYAVFCLKKKKRSSATAEHISDS